MERPRLRRPAAIRGQENPLTWANVVTAVRVAACVAIFAVAWVRASAAWSFAGLGVYWVLDVADGALARALDQETRLGAQMDILADRLLVALFYLNYLQIHPDLILPVALFLIQFMFVDHYLSNQFMRWPILSPNYFYLVDRPIWLLNWSVPGKLLNSAVVTAVLVFSHSIWLSSVVCLAILALKVYSCERMTRLQAPEPSWPQPPNAEPAAEG